jgi:hypothetical protein
LVRHGALLGQLLIDDFLPAYSAMHPSLHRYCNVPDQVDVEALLYVLARLPEGVHKVREILVQADLPDRVPPEGLQEVVVPTRRRATYLLGEERCVIVAREGVTELLDLATLLSAFEVESRKLERLLAGSELLDDLRTASPGPDENRLLVRLAFELGTRDELIMEWREFWGTEFLARVTGLVDNPPHVRVRLHRDYCLQSAQDRSRNWARRLAQEVNARTQKRRPIHLISSNTHSTVNLLSPFARQYREDILEWGQQTQPKLFSEPGVDLDNLLYFLLKSWLDAHPGRRAEQEEIHAECGLLTLTDLDRVGVTAQLIDLANLPLEHIDPRLGIQKLDNPPIIVNFDYAFGDQAGVVGEQLFRELAEHDVRSFSILGKAGSLVGERGSVMLPQYLLRESSRDIYDIPGGNLLRAADLPGLQVFDQGPVLTVLGTILQNDELLKSYRDEWMALGLEMEGIPYLRSVHQALKLGWISPQIKVAIGYYASDAPLVPGESLSRALSLRGLNPTYGLNLALLRKLLQAS